MLSLAVCSLIPQLVQGAETKGVKVVLTAEKAVYTPGEPITFTFRVVNGTPKPVRLSFRTTQRFDLVLQDQQGREVWRWSAGRVFAQVLGEETLNPSGGELLYQATVEGAFPQGVYTVTGIIPAMEGTLSASITLGLQ